MAQTIFTLNARENVMLEVVQSHFQLNQVQVFREINGLFSTLQKILRLKKLNYSSFKNALVPRPERNEAAFIFDRNQITSNWYGYDVFHQLLPLLNTRSVNSILCGDYIGGTDRQDLLRTEFYRQVELVKQTQWMASNQFFIVYINNLSDQMLADLRSGLTPYKGYIGFADCNSPSIFKAYLSMILCSSFLKQERNIIQAHEDDRDDREDINMSGYPFAASGYICKSLKAMFFDVFLSYKIERAVYAGFESDTIFSLNSISAFVVPLEDCSIEIEDSKLQYLLRQKQGSMKRAGLLNLSRAEVESRIRERLTSNYIFNMQFVDQHQTMKFNTVLNLTAVDTSRLVKVMAALEYKPREKLVRLITLF